MRQKGIRMETLLFDCLAATSLDETVEKRPKNTQDNGGQSSHHDDPTLHYDNQIKSSPSTYKHS